MLRVALAGDALVDDEERREERKLRDGVEDANDEEVLGDVVVDFEGLHAQQHGRPDQHLP